MELASPHTQAAAAVRTRPVAAKEEAVEWVASLKPRVRLRVTPLAATAARVAAVVVLKEAMGVTAVAVVTPRAVPGASGCRVVLRAAAVGVEAAATAAIAAAAAAAAEAPPKREAHVFAGSLRKRTSQGTLQRPQL